jgi:PadR family transcriptional regulator, regulatory protein PadR
MATTRLLGEVEQLLLLAILRVGEGAYAVPIREEIARAAGIELSRGTIYVTLDRLERKGFISSWFEDPTPEPGGKSKRCYRIERDGMAALRSARQMIDRLQAGTVLAGKGRKS